MWQYNSTQPTDELMHFGVKGMRWGIRHDVVVKKLEESYTSKGLTKEQANKIKRSKTWRYLTPQFQNTTACSERP